MEYHLNGLTAAAFTPLREDGTLDLDRIPALVDHLVQDGVAGLFVLGTTGQGPSFSHHERRAVAEAFVAAAGGRLPVVVHVGHESLAEARALAAHAQQVGADAIASVPPSYFKPATVALLVDAMAEVAAGAPGLPFYYYHIPSRTGVVPTWPAFLDGARARIPTLVGLKFSDTAVQAYQVCVQEAGFDALFGTDEMLLSALVVGGKGAVGSTYNFATPLFRRLMAAFARGDLAQARRDQARAARMVEVVLRHCGRAGFKAMMPLIGVDCGPQRLPEATARPQDVAAMAEELEALGFFTWGRSFTADEAVREVS